MKTQLISDLNANNIAAVFQLFLDPANFLLIHDTLIEECTIEESYFYVKALKLVNIDIFMAFAHASAASTYGSKQLLHNILTIYKQPPHNLEYNHPESDGIQPTLTTYCNIARSIL